MLEQYDDILTVEEACEALRIGRNSLYDLLHSNSIVGYRVGKHWRITKVALTNYIMEKSSRMG